MDKINSNQITMKPRWYFYLGSISLMTGLVASSITAIFSLNLIFFLLRQHGPRGMWRLQVLLSSFPWWVPILAFTGVFSGIWLLKKFDFSYKKNFALIASGFILGLIITAVLLDILGLNHIWFKRGPLRRYYRQTQFQDLDHQPSPHKQFRQQRFGK